jgi:hypothetical protein
MDPKSITDQSITIKYSTVTDSVIGIRNRVSKIINNLSASSNPEKPGIKELLTQLKTAIETESGLDEEKQIEALEEVQTLAEASQISKPEERKKPAKRAIAMLKDIFSGLQTGATLLETWNNILPLLSKLFGIG